MVGCQNDICVICFSRLLQRIQYAPNLRVEESYQSVIFTTVKLHGFFCSGKGGQHFVADFTVALIEGMFR